MELIRGQHNLRPRHRGCVLTIGNFDGIHLGHQVIIDQLVEIARATSLPATLLTFEPQPREILAPNPPARLTRLREKLLVLAETTLNRVLCTRFDRNFASQNPNEFIEQLLVAKLGVSCLVVGHDFRFGHRGAGDIDTLRAAGQHHGFEVIDCARYELDGRRVSSSWVREALAVGDLPLAARLLNRPYCIHGRISHGDQRGRSIGFPTANLSLQRRVSPIGGVFAVRVFGLGDAALPGVANVGNRPTVAGVDTRLEVHLFDFARDIYGSNITVELVNKIRDEQKFSSLDSLVAQIHRDAEQARFCLEIAN